MHPAPTVDWSRLPNINLQQSGLFITDDDSTDKHTRKASLVDDQPIVAQTNNLPPNHACSEDDDARSEGEVVDCQTEVNHHNLTSQDEKSSAEPSF